MQVGPMQTILQPDGLLLIDKPSGVTSHDVIDVARRSLSMDRIGHAGTLDPAATGLLLLLVGRTTRLLPYLQREPKEYDACIRFGWETDSDDASGRIVRDAPLPSYEQVLAGIGQLTGEFDQRPPSVSAKHHDGTRAYRAARKGRQLPLSSARVRVYGWTAVSYSNGQLRASISCGAGTYVRALARDLGKLCDSAAHLETLRRTRVGSFSVDDAISMRDVKEHDPRLIPPLAGLAEMPRVVLSCEHEKMIVHGRRIPAALSDERVALVSERGSLIAIAEHDDGDWKPKVVLVDA